MLKKLKNQNGFSLMEIMVVIGIIAVLVGGIISVVGPQRDRANRKTAESTVKQLAEYVKQYKQDKGQLPASLDDLVKDDFMSEVPLDPWGNPYVYENPGSHGHKYEIYSQGKSEDDESDDIKSWKDGDQ